jgi:serine/threonine-protein kinase RsbW
MNAMTPSARASSSGGTDRVEVSVPLRTEFFATLRTIAASLGADAGFSIDEIDDLRLAISEIVTSLADGQYDPDDRIDASFELQPGALTVTLNTRGSATSIQLDDLASSILASVVDRYDLDGASVTLVKSASEATLAAASHAQPATPNA